MKKYRLMTPGPTPVPESSLLTLARQVTHHRTAEFRALHQEVLEGLQEVLQTKNDILLIGASGTGGMEAAVMNLIRPGSKMLVLASGKFAERWATLGDRFGAEVVSYELPWGEPFEADEVARILDEDPAIEAVYGTLCETSTGVGHDVEAIGRVVQERDRLWVVDGISGAGLMECRTDDWGIDILVVGSQKALMTPPGLAIVTVSPRAWKKIETVDQRGFYLDLLAYRKALKTFDSPYTPPRSLIAALAESVRLLREAGIETVWDNGRRLARATRAGLERIGFRMAARRPADALTTAYVPDGVDAKRLLDRLETRFGLKLAGGQGPLSGKVIRIAHMGQIDQLDIVSALAAIELVLVEQGHSVQLGTAVAAAEAVFAEGEESD